MNTIIQAQRVTGMVVAFCAFCLTKLKFIIKQIKKGVIRMERYDFVKLTKRMQKKTGETDYLFCIRIDWSNIWLRLWDGKVEKFNKEDVDERTVISWKNSKDAYSRFIIHQHPNVTLTLRKYVQGLEKTQEIKQYYDYCLSVCEKYNIKIKHINVWDKAPVQNPCKDNTSIEAALNNLQIAISELQAVLRKES